MGCDIHVMVEARQYPLGPDKWFNVDNWRHDPNPDDKSKPALTVKPIYRHQSIFHQERAACNSGANSFSLLISSTCLGVYFIISSYLRIGS